MNREEAKQLLPIIKAFSEGAQMQIKQDSGWMDMNNDRIIVDDIPPNLYRIKPEPKYRPFKDAEECFEEMQKH